MGQVSNLRDAFQAALLGFHGNPTLACSLQNREPYAWCSARVFVLKKQGAVPSPYRPIVGPVRVLRIRSRETGFLAYLIRLPQVAAIMRQDQGEALA